MNELLTWLNKWVEEQPFLTALLTTAFSGFAIALIGIIINLWKKDASISDIQKRGWPDDITRSDLIERLLRDVIVRRASGLHEDVAIALKMQLQFSQVRPSFKLATTGTKPNRPLPEGTTIVDIYNLPEVQHKLLILGNPGAGKTTTLLELAHHLLRKAEEDVKHPVPVIFECSTWAGQEIGNWLVEELNKAYRLTKISAFNVLEKGGIILLLDGMDELFAQQQREIIQNLNKFLSQRISFVICSRIEEYELAKEEVELTLNCAVFIEPLTEDMIFDYLKKVKCTSVIHILEEHPKLLMLAMSPLFLSVMVICQYKMKHSAIPEFASESEYQSFLLNTYLEQRLEQQESKQTRYRYSRDKTLVWLSWLARNLKGRSRTSFELEDLQPTFLHYPEYFGLTVILFEMVFFGLLGGLIVVLDLWFPIWLSHEYKVTLAVRLAVGLAFGLALGLAMGLIYEIDSLFYHQKQAPQIMSGLAVGLAMGLAMGLGFGLALGLAFGLTFGLFFYFVPLKPPSIEPVEVVRIPRWSSRADWTTLASSLAFGLAYGLIAGLAIGLLVGLIEGLIKGLAIGLALGLVLVLLLVLLTAADFSIPILKKGYPNQGIRRSGLNGLMFATISSSLVILVGHSITDYTDYTDYTDWGWVCWPMVAIFFGLGGLQYIEHYCLRFAMWQQGHIPFCYVRFLNHMHTQKILQRVGSSYRFLHLSLRNHLAEELKNPRL